MLFVQCEILHISEIATSLAAVQPICVLVDLSKAFDKVNHDALFLKLTKRLIPIQLLNLLVSSWLSGCYSYVKWYHQIQIKSNLCVVTDV